jgi:ComF family protein
VLARHCSALIDLLYPRACGGCGRSVDGVSGHFCWDCRTRVELVRRPYCSLCGDPFEGMIDHDVVCDTCDAARPHFALARSGVRFRGPLREAMHAFKYARAAYLASDLAPFLVAAAESWGRSVVVDAVTAVPLYPLRERERSYNQALLLAAHLAAAWDLPLLHDALRRVRPTATQTALKAADRALNVRGAFAVACPERVAGRRLVLVDDIMTTGATVNECARVLREGGAVSVHVATVARG